jgi:hypothetical protein
VITSKPAIREQVKTGHVGPSGTDLFYPAAASILPTRRLMNSVRLCAGLRGLIR